MVQILDEYPENVVFRTAEGEPISLVDTQPDYDDPAAIAKAMAEFKRSSQSLGHLRSFRRRHLRPFWME